MSAEREISRRALVAGVCAACGVAAVGGFAKAYGAEPLLRPPGGQDEGRFLATCIKCDRCWSVCPLECVARADLADGLANVRTPTMDFHRGYCDFCGKCIEVCPTGALEPFDPEVDKIGVARINEDRCLNYLRGYCDFCVLACRYEALVIDANGHPVVDEARCNGCGECVEACESNVYTSFDGSRKRAIEVEVVAS